MNAKTRIVFYLGFFLLPLNLLTIASLFGYASGQTGREKPQATASSEVMASDHLKRAKQFGEAGNWVQAERELRTYKNSHPDSEEAAVLHAEALIELSQPFDAALELQLFLQRHPNSIRVLKLHAALASKTLLDDAVAQSELIKATQLDPKDAQAWRTLAEIYMDEGKMEDAVAPLKEANKLRPTDPVILASLAYASGQSSEPADVDGMFAKAIKLSEGSARENALVHMLYGRHLIETNRAEESIASFDKVLELNPHYGPGLYWRGKAYSQTNNLRSAEADALQAAKFAPNDNQAPLLLVSIYRKQGNAEKAKEYADRVEALAKAQEAQNANGRALRESLDRAEHLLGKGQYAAATPQYESIIQRLPKFYEAYFDLGMCYGQTQRLTEAEAAFRKYLVYQPLSPDGRAALGVLLMQMGRGKEAVSELEQAVQLDPENLEARKMLATEYLHETKPKEAIALLQPRANAQDKDLQLLAAEAYRQNGQFTAALKAVERALILAPDDAQSLQVKRQILAQQKESSLKPHSQLWMPGAAHFG